MTRLALIIPCDQAGHAVEETLASVLADRPEAVDLIVVHPGDYADPFDLADEVTFVSCDDGAPVSTMIARAAEHTSADWLGWIEAGSTARAGSLDAVVATLDRTPADLLTPASEAASWAERETLPTRGASPVAGFARRGWLLAHLESARRSGSPQSSGSHSIKAHAAGAHPSGAYSSRSGGAGLPRRERTDGDLSAWHAVWVDAATASGRAASVPLARFRSPGPGEVSVDGLVSSFELVTNVMTSSSHADPAPRPDGPTSSDTASRPVRQGLFARLTSWFRPQAIAPAVGSGGDAPSDTAKVPSKPREAVQPTGFDDDDATVISFSTASAKVQKPRVSAAAETSAATGLTRRERLLQLEQRRRAMLGASDETTDRRWIA